MSGDANQNLDHYRNLKNRIVDPDRAIQAMQTIPSILAVGTFDLLHPGHVDFLNKAKNHVGVNGLLVVGLVPDVDVEIRKGRTSVFNVNERAEMLANLRAVDLAFPFAGTWDDFIGLIFQARPKFFALNSDDQSNVEKIAVIRQAGGIPVIFKRKSVYSTSGIIKKIKLMC